MIASLHNGEIIEKDKSSGKYSIVLNINTQKLLRNKCNFSSASAAIKFSRKRENTTAN